MHAQSTLVRTFLMGAIMAFVVLIFMPIFGEDGKWNFVVPAAIVILLFSIPSIFLAQNWNTGPVKILGIILLWTLFIYIHRLYHPPGTEYAFTKFPYLILVSVVGAFAIPAAVLLVRGWTAFVITLTLIGVFFSLVSFFPSQTISNARYSVIGLNPVMLSKLAALPLITLIAYRSVSGRLKVVLWLAAFLAVAGCINSGSRSALLAVPIAYLVVLLFRVRVSELMKSSGTYVILGLIFVAYLSVANPELVERFTLESISIENNSDEGDRLFLYELSIDLIQRFPFGIGFGNFSTIFWLNAPHNIFLESLVELGFIGTIPLFLLAIYGFRSALYLTRSDNDFARYLAIFFFYNLLTVVTGGELTLASLLFYISIGLSAGYAGELAARPQARSVRPDKAPILSRA